MDVLSTIADLIDVPPPFETDGQSLVRDHGGAIVPADGAGGDTGIKQYARFTNPFQPEDDAVIDIEVDVELPRVLAGGRDVTAAEAEDPIGTFHRATPHGELYGQPISTLDIGDQTNVSLELDQRDQLESGADDDPIPVYLGGWTDSDLGGAGGDPWFVIALDGEVAALSPVFPAPGHDQAVGALIDPTRLDPTGNDVTAYLITRPGAPLRPVTLA
jgi:hypothetical protein